MGRRGYKLTDWVASQQATNPTGCWILPNKRPMNSGYHCLWVNGRSQQAHRVIYEMVIGPIPDGLELDHLCRNRPCANPSHMEPVTTLENIRRIPPFDRKPYSKKQRRNHCSRGHQYVEGSFKAILRTDAAKPYTERVCLICDRVRRKEKYARWVAKRIAEGGYRARPRRHVLFGAEDGTGTMNRVD